MSRKAQIDAVIQAARDAAGGDNATAVSLLVGALILLCAKSHDPIAVMQIAMNSIGDARDLANRVLNPGVVS